MKVNRHAAISLVALTQRMPVAASLVMKRLGEEPERNSAAIITCRMTMALGHRSDATSSNGDTVVTIARKGVIVTAMLRRSWNQAFTPEALRVDEVIDWTKDWAA